MSDHKQSIDILLQRKEKGEDVDHMLQSKFPFLDNPPHIDNDTQFYIDHFLELMTERNFNNQIPSSAIRDYAINVLNTCHAEHDFFCYAMRQMDNASIRYSNDNRQRKSTEQSKKSNLKKIRNKAIKEQSNAH